MNNICLTMNMRQTFTTNPLWMKVPASGTQTAATYYTYQNDHLGTPMKLLNQSGVTVWSATYDAFGRATVDSTSTVTNNFRYPGQYYDAESGCITTGCGITIPILGATRRVIRLG